MESEMIYQSEGYTEPNVAVVINLVIGVSIATLVLIFMGVLGGQVYANTEADIQAINDTTIKGYITDAITSGFKAQNLTGKYLPIIVLAVIIFVVIGLVTSLGGTRTAGYPGYPGGGMYL